MKKRILHRNVSRVIPRSSDKVVLSLPVDQFSVQDFNINAFGWPKSDITQIVELTSKKNIDTSRYEALAQRIHMLKAEPKNNKSFDDLLHDWRPSWMQTITEEQSFREWYYDVYENEVLSPSADSSDVSSGDVVVPNITES